MAEGQYTGGRKTYKYTGENGVIYFLSLDVTLATLAGTGLVEATTADAGTPAPKRFRPRGVYWQGVLGGVIRRKFIVCDSSGTLYQADNSQSLTIDGVAGVTTGRRGEKLSYARLAPAA